MKNTLLLAVALALLPGISLAAAPGGVSGAAPSASPTVRMKEADRKVVAGRILLKWGGYVEKVEGQDRKAWAAKLWPSLASADLDNLQKASRAITYEGMRNALLGQRIGDAQLIDRMARTKAMAVKSLGSLATDLVFTPVAPCRIVDTRNIGGRIASGETRDLNAANADGDFSLQGGDASNCGIPANPAAIALSVTALNNTTTGYLRVYPFDGTSNQGSPVPLNAVNTTVSNDIIVPTCQGCEQELKVFSTSNTHYAAFVTGYFMAPVATALECTSTFNSESDIVAGGIFNISIPACPTGYSLTGAGCRTPGFKEADWAINGIYGSPGSVDAYCSGTNISANPITVEGTGICCSIPGR